MSAPSLPPDRYKVLEEIGRGGMGIVYRAIYTPLERTVAVKVLSPSLTHNPRFLEYFQKEAMDGAGLNHPNIVRIYDIGQEGNTHFISMELVEGETLRELISREAPLPPQRVFELLSPVADALDYAHRDGLIHRDIKPGNILITSEGMIKLTDFGIAGAPDGAEAGKGILGTPDYISPEQALGRKVTASADIYSLGVVAFRCLTGKLPFNSKSALGMVYMHAHQKPEGIAGVRRNLPFKLGHVISKALAKNPLERYKEAGEFLDEMGDAVKSRSFRMELSERILLLILVILLIYIMLL